MLDMTDLWLICAQMRGGQSSATRGRGVIAAESEGEGRVDEWGRREPAHLQIEEESDSRHEPEAVEA